MVLSTNDSIISATFHADSSRPFHTELYDWPSIRFSRIHLHCMISAVQNNQRVVQRHQTSWADEVVSHQRSQGRSILELPQTPNHPLIGVDHDDISISVERHAGHVQPHWGLQHEAETVRLMKEVEVFWKHSQPGALVPVCRKLVIR